MHVAVDAGELLASYTTPGQYVQVRGLGQGWRYGRAGRLWMYVS